MAEILMKGNDPERWQKLLDHLDEKLQFGLLDQLRKVAAYHFEAGVLYLEPSTPSQAEYLKRTYILQQLQLLAQDAIRLDQIIVKDPPGTR